jgi:hypothetical protein
MKFVSGVFILVLALTVVYPPALSAEQKSEVVVLSSSDAPGRLSADKLKECLHQLAREWKQPEHHLPFVIVFHVSKRVAHAASVKDGLTVRFNRARNNEDSYYEVWLVGEPKVAWYVLGFAELLEDHFQLKLTDEQRRDAVVRVARIQDATISAFEGQ